MLLVVGVSALGWYLASAATTLRIAVGPAGGEDARLLAAIGATLARDRDSVRLKLLATRDTLESATAIDSRSSDLAVVRTDVAMPAGAQTVAILHRDAVMLLAPAGRGIATVTQLVGRTVGVVRHMPANERILDTLLAFYDVPSSAVERVVLEGPADVEMALRSGRVDAVLAVGTISGRTVSETFAAVVAAAAGATPVFIAVPEAGAIAQRSPAFETYEIVRGAFGGATPRPAEAVHTLGVTHRLVAASTVSDTAVSEFTKLLFAMRPRLVVEVPLANRLEAPDTSKSSVNPVHPGAAAYYDGEIPTFFERYEDWIYLGVMGLSILGSGAAGFASRAAGRRRVQMLGLLGRLLAIVREARLAASEHDLHGLETEADTILGVALDSAGSGRLDAVGVSAFTLGLEQVRQAIATQRSRIAARPRHLVQAAE